MFASENCVGSSSASDAAAALALVSRYSNCVSGDVEHVRARPCLQHKLSTNVMERAFHASRGMHCIHGQCASRWLEKDNRPCIQKTPPAFMGVLLGDAFFRSLVVQFDLTHPTIPGVYACVFVCAHAFACMFACTCVKERERERESLH
jgi:hypothetical protein